MASAEFPCSALLCLSHRCLCSLPSQLHLSRLLCPGFLSAPGDSTLNPPAGGDLHPALAPWRTQPAHISILYNHKSSFSDGRFSCKCRLLGMNFSPGCGLQLVVCVRAHPLSCQGSSSTSLCPIPAPLELQSFRNANPAS